MARLFRAERLKKKKPRAKISVSRGERIFEKARAPARAKPAPPKPKPEAEAPPAPSRALERPNAQKPYAAPSISQIISDYIAEFKAYWRMLTRASEPPEIK